MGAWTAKAALPPARMGFLSERLAELRERRAEMPSFSMGRTGRHKGVSSVDKRLMHTLIFWSIK